MDKMSDNEKLKKKSYLNALLTASDPESGEKLTHRETLVLSTGLMYPPKI